MKRCGRSTGAPVGARFCSSFTSTVACAVTFRPAREYDTRTVARPPTSPDAVKGPATGFTVPIAGRSTVKSASGTSCDELSSKKAVTVKAWVG